MHPSVVRLFPGKQALTTRQIILDTETTGLLVEDGHRIIEIGCVELIDHEPSGRILQQYLDPERDSDPGALAVHGIPRRALRGMPRFADIAAGLLDWLRGAELIIHNAPFDTDFLDAELQRLGPNWGRLRDHCARITCTRELARERLPGLKPSLDNLCDHYGIDRRHRTQHGALTDAQLLGAVYLALLHTEAPAEQEDASQQENGQ